MAGGIDTEFEFRVRDDDAARECVLSSMSIERERRRAYLLGESAPDEAHDLLVRDVLVVRTELGLGRGRENRFGQAIGLTQTRRKLNAADETSRLVILPAGADQVAANHGFDRQ